MEFAFEIEAGAFGDPRAGKIAGVAPDLDAPGPEGGEGEGVRSDNLGQAGALHDG
jgi:hypothetical protein